MGVHPVPTQCPTTTEFSSQVVRSPWTPAIPIKLITVWRDSWSAKPGWDTAFEIQMQIWNSKAYLSAFEIQMPLIGSAPLTPQGGRVGKNSIKAFLKKKAHHKFCWAKHKIVVAVFRWHKCKWSGCLLGPLQILVSLNSLFGIQFVGNLGGAPPLHTPPVWGGYHSMVD